MLVAIIGVESSHVPLPRAPFPGINKFPIPPSLSLPLPLSLSRSHVYLMLTAFISVE
jgi:hypothetical protein